MSAPIFDIFIVVEKCVFEILTVIIPVYNAEKWIDECLKSVLIQDFKGNIEVSLYNDGSTDTTLQLLKVWKIILEKQNISVVIKGHEGPPKGVGFAKNRAVDNSHGEYLCFLDASWTSKLFDDVMTPDRVDKQFHAAKSNQNTIVGSCFHREPVGSTERFTQWANRLTPDQLYTQIKYVHQS
ncbi:hypothetical protein KUTeg_004031 [Tegillarca granosa]|uniref:Glycosyltransferase 2-like domain-containing protein n=1 Tax=Tegillarca granosa TaxID=220873 RepID=A0ABQ9FRN1_TEGGR|nr:hypothetical protein KUTeg_004031 [Tegillarca granosa]